MNTDQAYILGLVVGGGKFSADETRLTIKLPYKQWGDVSKNPKRAGMIATDIMKVIAPVMKSEYGIDISYITTPSAWIITGETNVARLITELRDYGIDIWKLPQHTCDISGIVAALVDDNMKRRFIAGIADTIGSMAESHRRFSDDVQIVSFEISGFAFHFVCQLCNLLYSIGCIPDQILWQHPNLQSGLDRYYTSWKKGNKLRITLDAYSSFGALAFRSKAEAASKNRAKQTKTNKAEICEERPIVVSGQTSKHIDEGFSGLPDDIRDGHYLHSKHICAVLRCPHAPYCEVNQMLQKAHYHVSPFTVLTKDTAANISNIIIGDPILSHRKYTIVSVRVADIMSAIDKGATMMNFMGTVPTFRNDIDYGYPLNIVVTAMGYILASQTGELNGRRIRGSQSSLIERALTKDPNAATEFLVPDKLTPIIVTDGKASAMVGPADPETFKKLISIDPMNPCKMYVRDITEADLR